MSSCYGKELHDLQTLIVKTSQSISGAVSFIKDASDIIESMYVAQTSDTKISGDNCDEFESWRPCAQTQDVDTLELEDDKYKQLELLPKYSCEDTGLKNNKNSERFNYSDPAYQWETKKSANKSACNKKSHFPSSSQSLVEDLCATKPAPTSVELCWNQKQDKLLSVLKPKSKRKRSTSARPSFCRDISTPSVPENAKFNHIRSKGQKQRNPKIKEPQDDVHSSREVYCLNLINVLIVHAEQLMKQSALLKSSVSLDSMKPALYELKNFLDDFCSQQIKPVAFSQVSNLLQVIKHIMSEELLPHILPALRKELCELQLQIELYLKPDMTIPRLDEVSCVKNLSEYLIFSVESVDVISSDNFIDDAYRALCLSHYTVLCRFLDAYCKKPAKLGTDLSFLNSCLSSLQKLLIELSKNKFLNVASVLNLKSNLVELCRKVSLSLPTLDASVDETDSCCKESSEKISKTGSCHDGLVKFKKVSTSRRFKKTGSVSRRRAPTRDRTTSCTQDTGNNDISERIDNLSVVSPNVKHLSGLELLVERICSLLKGVVSASTHEEFRQFSGELSAVSAAFIVGSKNADLELKDSFIRKLNRLKTRCDEDKLDALSYDFLYALLMDVFDFQNKIHKKIKVSTPSATPKQDEGSHNSAAFMSVLSSVVCDLYVTYHNRKPMFGALFHVDLTKLVQFIEAKDQLLNKVLGYTKIRQFRQELMRLLDHFKDNSSKLSWKGLLQLIRLLLEIRLHFDRANISSSSQLMEVQKTIPFNSVDKYLCIRNSKVIRFTGWLEDKNITRKMLDPETKDHGILRVERQCGCITNIVDGKKNRKTTSIAKYCLVSVDVSESPGNHVACLRLLNNFFLDKKLKLEPYEATIALTVSL